MKIVVITNTPSPFQIKWCEFLRKHHDVEFWFMTEFSRQLHGKPDYWNIKLPKGCKQLPTKIRYMGLSYAPTLTKELENFNPDVVVIGGGWYMIYFYQGYRWAVKNNKMILTQPVEFSKHMYGIIKIFRNKIVYKWLYRKVDLWLANGFIHYDYLTHILKRKSRIFMNYDDYSPYLNYKRNYKRNVVQFLFAGALERRNRVPEIIQVFGSLLKKYNNINLVIGGFGKEKQRCRDVISESTTLSKNVSFKDVKSWDEIPKLFSIADVLINYASYSPGSGVILSAVASGMPVISGISVHACRHFVIDSYNGYLVYDQLSLFNAMKEYIENPLLLSRHGKRSRQIATESLTFEKHVTDFNKCITECLPK